MALLNYAKTYDEIKHALEFPVPDAAANGQSQSIVTGDFAKIFFSGEGDIITHGVNFTPVFKGGAKGLVPQSAQNGTRVNFLANDGTWKELTLGMLPMAKSINDFSEDTLFTSQQIHDHFQSQLSAVDAMRFVGTIDPDNVATFPTKEGKIICEKGDTYRVSKTGEYAGFTLRAGDLLICVKDSPAGATASDIANELNEYWTVVESNINGSKTHYINNTKVEVFTNDLGTDPVNIWAPKTAGLTGQVLVSRGQDEDDPTPTWVDQSTLMAGSLTDALKDKILTNVTLSTDGTLMLTDLANNTTSSTKASGTWEININGVAREVGHILTLGTGLRFADAFESYNGAADRQILLSAATSEAIGGVIIDNVAAGSNGKVGAQGDAYKATISVTSNGNIFLTPDNIINALGYKPGSSENVNDYTYFFAENNNSLAGVSAEKVNPYFNMTAYNELSQGKTIASSVQFVGENGLTVKATASNSILFNLEQATDSVRGGIKIGYNTANKKYAVQLDADGKAFVDVPWEDTTPAFSHIKVGSTTINAGTTVDDTFELIAGNGVTLTADAATKSILIDTTTYDVVSVDANGLAPKMVTSGKTINNSYHILSFNNQDQTPEWSVLPATAFSDTWRRIFVGGDEILNSANDGLGLNFVGSGKTTVETTDATDYKNVVINSTWRDIYVNNTKVDENHAFKVMKSDDILVTEVVDNDNRVTAVEFEILWYNLSTKDQETVQ